MTMFIYDKRGTVLAPLKLSAIVMLFVIRFLMPLSANAASFSSDIKDGNSYYKQGEYDKALEKYKAAGEASPDSDIANFNKGTAYYQKGQYQAAIDAFSKALNTEDKKTEADSTYNIANAKYKLGSSNVDRDINSAVGLYRESLDYYKRAIELDEGNRDAKYNHELVERKLKVLLDKLKNQKQQEKDRKKEQDSDKKKEQSDDTKESGSNESKEEKDQQGRQTRNDQGKKEQKSDQQQAGGGETKQEQKQEQKAGMKEGKNGGMSPREARMLLNAFGEQEARDAVRKQKEAHYPEVLKDW